MRCDGRMVLGCGNGLFVCVIGECRGGLLVRDSSMRSGLVAVIGTLVLGWGMVSRLRMGAAVFGLLCRCRRWNR